MSQFGYPRLLCLLAGMAGVACGSGDHDEKTGQHAAQDKLSRALPAARILNTNAQVARVYGPALATGDTPLVAARNFLSQHAQALGVDESELRPRSSGAAIPIKYDPKTKKYQFSLVRYEQHKDDIPVHGSELGVMVRNDARNSVVLVASAAKNLGGFVPRLLGKRVQLPLAQTKARAAVQHADNTRTFRRRPMPRHAPHSPPSRLRNP
jgi:hypothetical protein